MVTNQNLWPRHISALECLLLVAAAVEDIANPSGVPVRRTVHFFAVSAIQQHDVMDDLSQLVSCNCHSYYDVKLRITMYYGET